jgi:aspartyl-tRNA(Asn)/glutamyl-tRNA(Gln) amidotransferase subunit C
MAITFDDVRQIAALARVGIDETRLPVLTGELSRIIDHMAVLTQVDVSASDAVDAARAESGAPLRRDTGPPIPLSESLSHFAPDMRGGFFIVPRLATHEDDTAEGEA